MYSSVTNSPMSGFTNNLPLNLWVYIVFQKAMRIRTTWMGGMLFQCKKYISWFPQDATVSLTGTGKWAWGVCHFALSGGIDKTTGDSGSNK